jgi:pilus assembly protein CpaE
MSSAERKIPVPARTIRVAVITSPDQLDQEWLNRLAREPEVESVDRVGGLAAGISLVQQNRPDLVIVDRDLEQTEQAIRQIFTSMPSTLCIAVVAQADVATLRKLVAAGARDVISRPVNHSDLMAGIRSVLSTEQDRRSRALVADPGGAFSRGRGKLIVLTSPKGGVGTTTIATNLAVALRQLSSGRVVLADFGLQFGDVGVQLNMWSRHTLQDLLAHVDDLDDAMLQPVLQPHSSGIQVLLAPNTPDVAGEVTEHQITSILEALLERNTYVVCDTWSFLDEVTETLLSLADEVLVVTTPEVPALKNTKFFLEHMNQQGLTRGRTTLVLNRFPSVNGIALQDVQKHLRHPVGANIPSEGQFVTHSVNRGIPVVASHPQSWVAQSLFKLAAFISGDDVSTISLMNPGKAGKTREPERPATQRRSLMRLVRGES